MSKTQKARMKPGINLFIAVHSADKGIAGCLNNDGQLLGQLEHRRPARGILPQVGFGLAA